MSEQEEHTAGIGVSLIRLADGTLIDPLTREPISGPMQNKKSNRADADDEPRDEPEQEDDDTELQIVPVARRSIADLGLSPAHMAVINNVLVYTLWGLPDFEIAIQCNCEPRQVEIIRNLDDYKKMHAALIEGLRQAYSGSIEGIFREAAPKAAKGIIRRMKSKSEDISMSAMKDILDRAGHRPADRVEHNHTFGNNSELVIRVIRHDEANAVPTLDLNPNA